MNKITGAWAKFKEKHPAIAQFLVFFILSNGMTVLQMILMPLAKSIFGATSLIDVNFQILPVGANTDGSQYYVFNYASGALADGGGGGLAYFLAMQLTLAVAQVVNFFLQRNVTFKSDGSVLKAAFWYILAYIAITLIAGAAQGLYKAPIYDLLMNTWNMGKFGETLADVIVTIINSAISFWVFFPIFKVIFKEKKSDQKETA